MATGTTHDPHTLGDAARFRVNVFRQRGSFAIVMRVIASKIPSFADLRLPAVLGDVAMLKNGLVPVTGQTGSGKSSTLAAVIDRRRRHLRCHPAGRAGRRAGRGLVDYPLAWA
jgi:twitching motility protein PilT